MLDASIRFAVDKLDDLAATSAEVAALPVTMARTPVVSVVPGQAMPAGPTTRIAAATSGEHELPVAGSPAGELALSAASARTLLATTASLASVLQESVVAEVQAHRGGVLDSETSEKVTEIAAQIASIVVLTQVLLNRGLVSDGAHPFDFVQGAHGDLDALENTLRLIDRLALAGADDPTCALARSRVLAAVERLATLAGVVGGKIDEVRAFIDQVGLNSDIDDFADSIGMLRERIELLRGSLRSPSAAAPVDRNAKSMDAAVRADTRTFADTIASTVQAIDSAAHGGASGAVTVGEESCVAEGAQVLPPITARAMPVAAVGADPLSATLDAGRWLDDLAREYGTLDAAAWAYGLDRASLLRSLVEAIADKSYDPLRPTASTRGADISQFFDDEDAAWKTLSTEISDFAFVTQRRGRLFETGLSTLLSFIRSKTQGEGTDDTLLRARRRRCLVGEVVRIPNSSADGPRSQAPATGLGRRDRLEQRRPGEVVS